MQLYIEISHIIYILFGRVAMAVGARSRFRWKLHPSSQAWPLLSTSNCRKTAIAICENLFELRKRECIRTD